MELITQELIKVFEQTPLYSTEKSNPVPVIVKYFNPYGRGTWYAVEAGRRCKKCGSDIPAGTLKCTDKDCELFDRDQPDSDWLFFGLADIFEKELGYFTLSELQSVTIGPGLTMERDLYFDGYYLDKKQYTVFRKKA